MRGDLSVLSYPDADVSELQGKIECSCSCLMPERIQVGRVEVRDSRIPEVPVVRTIPPAVEPPPPVTTTLAPPTVPVPGFVPPSYVPPSLTPPAPEPTIATPQLPAGLDTDKVEEYAGSLGIPNDPFGYLPEEGTEEVIEVLGRDIPIPKAEVVALAGTTAIASVTAALLGKALVEFLIKLMKPVVKQAIAKAKKAFGLTLTIEESQLYFAFEQKSLRKRLKAEQQADLSRQRLHQRKP